MYQNYPHQPSRRNSSSYPCLSDEDQVRGTAFVRLVEDHLFFIISAVKHLDAQASAVMWSAMLPNHNYLSRWLVRKYVQIVQTRRFKCTSIGELTEDELRVEALKDIRALAGQLGSSRFIAGDNLTIYDFSIAAHIASILYWTIDVSILQIIWNRSKRNQILWFNEAFSMCIDRPKA